MEYKLLSHLYYQNEEEYVQLYRQRLCSETTTILPFKIHDKEAFFCLCPEIYSLTESIMELDKEVSVLCEILPKVARTQFANRCLVDEILLTNDIEGVYSTRKEISAVLNELHKSNKKRRFYGLVQKYSMLNSETFSLQSCSDIRKIYDELVMPEVIADDPDNAPDGTIFRKDHADVATATQKVIHHGTYPENKIIEQMEQALIILNSDSLSPLLRVSIFHHLFGYIHPFYDGNGRTSRFISSYLLSKKFHYLIGYRLSYTIKENINKYYEAFKICNDSKNCGDLTPFILMFLNIVKESFSNLYGALEKRAELLKKYVGLLNKVDTLSEDMKGDFCYVLIQAALFSNKGISKSELCNIFEVSISTVDKRLAKVREASLLKETKGERPIHYSLDLEKLDNLK